MKYKQLIQRHSHAAAVIAKSACEVIIFGGKKDHTGSSIADQVVLKFGKYFSELIFCYLL